MSRVGMLGLSMGGMESLLLAAVDERVGCVVSVSGQLSWHDVFETNSWKLIFTGLPLTDRLRTERATDVYDAFLRQMPELAILDSPRIAASLAPRPLLIMTGEQDPYITPAATRRTYDASLSSYSQTPARLKMWIAPNVGHAFSTPMQLRALAWFKRWLMDRTPDELIQN